MFQYFAAAVRAGSNGTAGMAMAILVFGGEKWLLTYTRVME